MKIERKSLSRSYSCEGAEVIRKICKNFSARDISKAIINQGLLSSSSFPAWTFHFLRVLLLCICVVNFSFSMEKNATDVTRTIQHLSIDHYDSEASVILPFLIPFKSRRFSMVY